MNIRDAIVEAINKDPRGLTQLARAAGVSMPTLYRLIGKENVTIETAERMARILGLTYRPLTEPERIVLEERRARTMKIATSR